MVVCPETAMESAASETVSPLSAVLTNKGRIETRLLVNTAGAWGGEIGRMAGLPAGRRFRSRGGGGGSGRAGGTYGDPRPASAALGQ